MKLRYKILSGITAFLVLSAVGLGMTLSYTPSCDAGPAASAGPDQFTAVRYHCYGSSDVLELEQVDKPVPGDNEVLVRVEAAAVNPLDWHYMQGSPYFMRLMTGIGKPRDHRLGADFAGVVEAAGKDVTRFEPGDAVFGGTSGAYGEYITKSEDGSIAAIPSGVTFEQAAALPIAAVTALQALRDHGRLEPGQHVLINGASGGVGTFAVQIAKATGATVTGVCSERNRELVMSIGADDVIDYKVENYTDGDTRYDLIVDMIGNHSISENLDVLTPDGRLVIVGGKKSSDDFIGPAWKMMTQPLHSMYDKEVIVFVAELDPDDLAELADMISAGTMTPVIDRVYSLEEIADAMDYLETRRARGKIIIDID